jgi:excinuclease ABC subunit C
VNKRLETKLKDLPKEPGVYFHKSASGEIIYVGKAAVLRNRVRQYFQASRSRDPKTEALVEEIYDTDWMVVESELEALFLEAEMIRRYMPRYNILLRDDKAMSYIRIDYDSDFPTVSTTRRPLDDGARYFGPYFSTYGVRQALKVLRRIFPFATRRVPGQKRATLHYHLGLDPGLEEGKTSLEDYRANLRKLMAVIEGKRTAILKEIERDMKRAAKASEFEKAAKLRNQLFALQNLNKQIIFSDKEFMDISKDHALNELVELLGLSGFPRRIEGYDISHMQGTNVVASMVVFTNGVSDKGAYRKFKMSRQQNDDFYNMHETLTRRLSEKNVKAWGKPDLFLIDGGKGQLDAAIRARDERAAAWNPKLAEIPFIGLAKREEQIVIKKVVSSKQQVTRETQHSRTFIPTPGSQSGAGSVGESSKIEKEDLSTPADASGRDDSGGSKVTLNMETMHRLGGFATESQDFILVNMPHSTNLVKLLQRIRDESHRFAVSYHSVLKVKHQTASMLDDIPTIGPATRKKLIKTFGSLRGVMQARDQDLIHLLGEKKATILKQYLRPLKKEQKAAGN